MKRLLFLLLFTFCSCQKHNKIQDGFYCQTDYLSYVDEYAYDHGWNSGHIVLRIKNDSLSFWGNIQFWERGTIVKHTKNSDTLYAGFKLYAGHMPNIIYMELKETAGTRKIIEYERLADTCQVINERREFVENSIRFNCLNTLKLRRVFAGKYDLNGSQVTFQEDGTVRGLNEFKKYSIYFRGGTNFPFDATNLISTDNGIWKYSIIGNKYVFTKYKDERPDTDNQYELSEQTIELIKR